jgi:hypothetical protein
VSVHVRPDGSEQIYWIEQAQGAADVYKFLEHHKLGLTEPPSLKRKLIISQTDADWYTLFVADAKAIQELIIDDANAAIKEDYVPKSSGN